MGQPHKHAALIKAWADGAEIQIEASEERWVDDYPLWNPSFKYRIKPKTIKYRNFLWHPYSTLEDTKRLVIGVCTDQENRDEPREQWCGFVKWLGDWQEVEVS